MKVLPMTLLLWLADIQFVWLLSNCVVSSIWFLLLRIMRYRFVTIFCSAPQKGEGNRDAKVSAYSPINITTTVSRCGLLQAIGSDQWSLECVVRSVFLYCAFTFRHAWYDLNSTNLCGCCPVPCIIRWNGICTRLLYTLDYDVLHLLSFSASAGFQLTLRTVVIIYWGCFTAKLWPPNIPATPRRYVFVSSIFGAFEIL